MLNISSSYSTIMKYNMLFYIMFHLISLLILWTILSLFINTPLFLNIWIRFITGIIVFFLFKRKTSGLTLYIIEERISYFIIFIWILFASKLFVTLLIIIKGAFPPFHQWFIETFFFQETFILLWGLTFHKIPIYILWTILYSTKISFLLVMSSVIRRLIIWNTREFQNILILSSRSTIRFIWIICPLSISIRRTGLVIYFITLWRRREISNYKFNRIFLILGLAGLPPLPIFQIKFLAIEKFIETIPTISIFLLRITILSSIGYLRVLIIIKFNKLDFSNRRILFIFWILSSPFILLTFS